MSRLKIIPYNPALKQLARDLRNNSTMSEIILWSKLKGKQMMGFDFHRQKPLDNFIVDFFCNELMLAIEIDGSTHNEKMEKDQIRQKKLENLGIKFLRFQDKDVRFNLDNVLITIEGWIREHTPSPSQEGS
jgi:very-short-patch-repair endonuclease